MSVNSVVPTPVPGRRLASFLCAAVLVSGCGGGGGGGDSSTTSTTTTTPTPTPTTSSLTLTLPRRAITASELAVIVAEGDSLSESIASYYQTARGIPAANIIKVKLPGTTDAISSADFATLKASIDAQLPSGVQATLVTWTAPSRVAGASCSMSLTSALALGYDAQYCSNPGTTTTCQTTKASAYFDSESTLPVGDLAIRPAMMLGASTLEAAKTLIDRGVAADGTLPAGDGYLLRTSDADRSVRYSDYLSLPTLWSGNSGLTLNYIDNSAGAAANSISGVSNVLFYFTGLSTVPNLSTLNFRPGAVADHLTSFGGLLPGGNGQMPITNWLTAGATASYGAVQEPCNYTQKFSKASVLIDQYYRGATLIEAYWKSVQWPGEGLFVGEPLARPFPDAATLVISNGQYVINTRGLRAGSSYSLDYRTSSTGSWTTLASFTVSRAQPQTLTASLAPAAATQLRWVGPCAADSSQQCTLATSS